jgi:hypothetical protein
MLHHMIRSMLHWCYGVLNSRIHPWPLNRYIIPSISKHIATDKCKFSSNLHCHWHMRLTPRFYSMFVFWWFYIEQLSFSTILINRLNHHCHGVNTYIRSYRSSRSSPSHSKEYWNFPSYDKLVNHTLQIISHIPLFKYNTAIGAPDQTFNKLQFGCVD